ncbi:MAG: MoaD/ThiS family protein [Nanoarchaeota archaeon]|nr:MoaD/ThiS family protein [Nanoarchaeota archaeon]MBU1603787.1 MoaD/ThiS family protein [Nanoarchaeota archaeon]MBU2443912.1 MoaD/ThiS family protein [Nanoarchaeota archaeon]
MIIMEIFIEKTNKRIKKNFSGIAKDLLKILKMNSESVLIVRNDELITEEEQLKNTDDVKILSVISGG